MKNSREWQEEAAFSFEGQRGDRERLLWLGERLDFHSSELGSDGLSMWLARALLRVRDRRGKIVPLEANAAQRAYEQRRGTKNIVLKARQMGISTWIAGRFFLKTITQPGTLTVEVAHNRESAEQIFRIVHRFYEMLPAGLRSGALRTSRINTRQLLFPELDSEYRVESAADANAGRGMTIQNLHCSEIARWRGDASETMASLSAALVPHGEIVLESTPNGAYGHFFDQWQRAQETGMVRHFFPWWMEPAYIEQAIPEALWTAEERVLAERNRLLPEQIGFRRQLHSNFGKIAAQEYAESPVACFLASGDCVFDLESIAQRAQHVHEPLEKRRNGELWIWYPPQPGRKYLVGVDPAGGGTDGDYAAIQVIEQRSGLQCAEFQGHTAPQETAKVCAELAEEYNRAVIVVERNNHGMAVLAYLSTIEHYPAIYEQRGQAGWLTTAVTRPAMIALLGGALATGPEIFSSSRLLAECRTFVRQSDGRTGAASGVHDDCVMAMAIALHARTEMCERPSAER
ncbi:MAG: phage terminase large subunit family protein [Acidobacteriaceae bacterium]